MGDSDTTCHTPTMAKALSTSTNVVRLIPIPNYAHRPLLHMEYLLQDPDVHELVLETLDNRERCTTMEDVLSRYSGRIESIQLDVNVFPHLRSSGVMQHAVELPFLTSPAAFATMPPIPHFTVLKDLTITSSHVVSIRSVLELLHICPMLRTLAIHNNRRHSSVFPESLDSVSEPVLPFLEQVTVDGLLTGTVEDLLDKLLPSLRESTKVEAHFYDASFPVLEHGPALQKLCSTIRHGYLSYMSLDTVCGAKPDSKSRYLLSFSDAAARIQLSWHWTEEPGKAPNLAHIGLVSSAFRNMRELSLFLRNVRPSYYDMWTVTQSFRSLKRVELISVQLASDSPASPSNPVEADGRSRSDLRDPKARGTPLGIVTHQRVFTVRPGAGPLLRRVANVPLLFSVEIAQALCKIECGNGYLPPTRTSTAAQARPQLPIPAHLLRWVRYYYDPIWALMVRRATRWEL
ncbi:hypothetical protein C8Q80DRAFT_1195818 [Daedaleopsis nitida]|nr:hypothetical protein C8Q80DRAFT_1195818 [Daedaleopsis nitida]